jgi:IS605 OrfB family transposase
MRTAYRCRAYPDEAQQAALNRTFGCVRAVRNRTLAARQARWHTERKNTSYTEYDRALTALKKDPGLARAISGCGWGEFRRQLAYKCQRYGRRLVVIDRWYPSSKTCSACGHRLAELALSTRHWTCPSCGTRHDRDLNAAKNILAAGRAVARGCPGDACGADVRHSGSSGCGRRRNRNPGPRGPGSPSLRTGSSQSDTGYVLGTV